MASGRDYLQVPHRSTQMAASIPRHSVATATKRHHQDAYAHRTSRHGAPRADRRRPSTPAHVLPPSVTWVLFESQPTIRLLALDCGLGQDAASLPTSPPPQGAVPAAPAPPQEVVRSV